MSSVLLSILGSLVQNNYVSVAMVTAVVYDYSLTFFKEIVYVWCRPWTWVSTVFVLVRYVGLIWIIFGDLVATSFVPGPQTVSALASCCTVMYLVSSWAYQIFLVAADLVMILRVYAMWNRSRRILYIFFIYMVQTVAALVLGAIYNNPNTHLSVAVIHVFDLSFCNVVYENDAALLSLCIQLPRVILATTLLVLAVTRTLREAIAMYKRTKRWQVNRYMQLLARDGIIYFLAMMLLNVTSIIDTIFPTTNNGIAMQVLGAFSDVAVCVAMPRFIISVRELYDQDRRGQCDMIDNGFGVSSQPVASQHSTVSAMAFADVAPGQDDDADRLGGIQVE